MTHVPGRTWDGPGVADPMDLPRAHRNRHEVAVSNPAPLFGPEPEYQPEQGP